MLVTTAVVLPLLSVRLHYQLLVLAFRVVRALRTRADAARRLLLLGRGLHGVYTSLGFGDIVPLSNGRPLVVVETLTGLVLIAWTRLDGDSGSPPVFERLRPTLPGRVPAEDDPGRGENTLTKWALSAIAPYRVVTHANALRMAGSRSSTRWASATSRSSSETATAGPPGPCRSRAAAAEGRPCSPATARVSAANSACCASRTSARAPRSR